jgi:hypothetical protein
MAQCSQNSRHAALASHGVYGHPPVILTHHSTVSADLEAALPLPWVSLQLEVARWQWWTQVCRCARVHRACHAPLEWSAATRLAAFSPPLPTVRLSIFVLLFHLPTSVPHELLPLVSRGNNKGPCSSLQAVWYCRRQSSSSWERCHVDVVVGYVVAEAWDATQDWATSR